MGDSPRYGLAMSRRMLRTVSSMKVGAQMRQGCTADEHATLLYMPPFYMYGSSCAKTT